MAASAGPAQYPALVLSLGDLESRCRRCTNTSEFRSPARTGASFRPEQQEEKLRNVVRQEMERGFDLTKAPLLQLSVFRISGNRWYVFLSHHHLILDGCRVVSSCRKWGAFTKRRKPAAPSICPRQTNFVTLHRLAREAGSWKAEQFWRSYLAGVRATTALPENREPAPNSECALTSAPSRSNSVRWRPGGSGHSPNSAASLSTRDRRGLVDPAQPILWRVRSRLWRLGASSGRKGEPTGTDGHWV